MWSTYAPRATIPRVLVCWLVCGWVLLLGLSKATNGQLFTLTHPLVASGSPNRRGTQHYFTTNPQPKDPGTSIDETSPWIVSRALLNTSNIPFEAHHGPTPMDTWLQQTLNFTLLLPLVAQVQHAHGEHQVLKNRGEAHVTVVTPPEFDQILAPVGITAQQLESIAHDYRLQDAPLEVYCVGRQMAYNITTNEKMYAYNLLMYSSTWLEIRWAIWRAFVAKGGEPSWFSPTLFFPHVTLGYTHRDLHIQDGVFKGVNSCWHATITEGS